MNSFERPLSHLGLPEVEPVEDNVNVEDWIKSMRDQGITPEEAGDEALRHLITNSNWDESGLNDAVVSKLRAANKRYNENLKPEDASN